MIGRTFNRLTVFGIDHWKPDGRDGRRYYYAVKCICGTEKIVLGDNIVKGGVKSCGCLRHEGHPGYNKLPEGEASFRSTYHIYQSKAKHQKLPFDLNIDQFRQLVKQNCFYCGAVPSNVARNAHCNGHFVYTGIDRVNNTLGYTLSNVVPCCKACNVAKNNRTQIEFFKWAKRIVKLHP